MPTHPLRRNRAVPTRSRGRIPLWVEELEARDVPSGVHPDYFVLQPQQGGSQFSATPDGEGYTPTQIRHAYGTDQLEFTNGGTTIPADGAGTTIAIVDAFSNPDIVTNLQEFDVAFGLPDPPSFQVVNQTGGSTLPASDPEWAGEIALDVEWSHAIAPEANILLVEANDNSVDANDVPTNLLAGVAYASQQPGVVVVSMSFGGGEYPDETSSDSVFQATNGGAGVTYVASTGDYGSPPQYPSTSPDVLAVGGTTTYLDSSGNISSEIGWGLATADDNPDPGSSDGGISQYEPQPLYQAGVVSQSTTYRTVPDVSYDSDPETGFPIYDLFNDPPDEPWTEIGGTSDAAPQWAALIAIADQGRALDGLGPLNGATQTLPMIYGMPSSNFNDVTTGTSLGVPEYNAGPGYDLMTGLGTPVANLVVPALVGLSVTDSNPANGSTVSIVPTSYTVDFSFPVDPSTVLPYDFTVNGLPANNVVVDSSDMSATFTFNQSPITDAGQYTMSIAGGSFSMLGNPSATNLDYDGSFTYFINPATHFAVSSPSSVTAGQPFSITVTALDEFGNAVLNYSGTINFSVSQGGSGVQVPGNYTFLSSEHGVHVFHNAFVLVAAGSQSIIVTDTLNSDVAGITGPMTVNAGGVSQLLVGAPSAIAAGRPFAFAVTVEDRFNNLIAGFTGTLSFSSTDPQDQPGAGLPVDATLTSGTGFFAGLLKTLGNQTISVAVVGGSATGTSNTVTVSAGAASQFALTVGALPTYPNVLSGPTSFATTGLPFSFTVQALDAYGNFVPGYDGTVQFTSSDSAASLPAAATLAAGVGTFSATLGTAGAQTLTATDTVQSSGPNAITGTSDPIATRGLVVSGFTPTASGFTIAFDKPFNPSTVNLYSTGSLPDDVMLATTNSQVSVRGSLVITSPTTMTFVKTDTVAATGAFNSSSGLLAAGKYTLTLRSYSAGSSGFEDMLGSLLDGTNSGVPGANFQITFAVGAPAVAVGIPDFARGPSNTDALFFAPTLASGSTFALSYTNPAASPTTGTATVTFSANAATLQSNIQSALISGGLATQIGVGSGNTLNAAVFVTNDGSTGANVLVTFQGALAQAGDQLLSSTTPGVTAGPASINTANNIPGSGIPIGLSSGLNVTSGSFTLQYNPTLLNVIGVVPSAAISAHAGASFTLVSNTVSGTSGTLVLSLSSPSRISSSSAAITLGSLMATVPLSAASSYGAKQLLHFSSEQLNGTAGSIAATNADGVQVVAYFGDVTDTGGPLILADSSAIAADAGKAPNVTAQTMPGVAAFPDLDPIIVGDVALQGSVNFTDAGVMNQEVAGRARPTIPYAPIGLPITPVGPDPTLSVSGTLVAAPGATIIVPVNIDTARPEGSSGMVDASLALTYDPNVFDVSAADVQLGGVPAAGSGWQLQTVVNAQTGLIGVELFSNTPILSAAGGSLITVALHVRATAASDTAGLTLVPYVDPTGGLRVYPTQVSDAQGAFVLHTAETPVAAELAAPIPLMLANGASAEGSESSALSSGATTDESAAEVGATADLPRSPAPANALAWETVDQVFGALVQSPGNNQLPTANFSDQAEWLEDTSPPYIPPSAQATQSSPFITSTVFAEAAAGPDDADLAGLEAFFAQESRRRRTSPIS